MIVSMEISIVSRAGSSCTKGMSMWNMMLIKILFVELGLVFHYVGIVCCVLGLSDLGVDRDIVM